MTFLIRAQRFGTWPHHCLWLATRTRTRGNCSCHQPPLHIRIGVCVHISRPSSAVSPAPTQKEFSFVVYNEKGKPHFSLHFTCPQSFLEGMTLEYVHDMTMRSRPLFSSKSFFAGVTLRLKWLLLSLLLLLLSFSSSWWVVEASILGTKRHRTPEQRNVMIINNSGRRIDLFWMDTISELPNKKEGGQGDGDDDDDNGNNDNYPRISQTDQEGIPVGGETSISSYYGHDFEIVELPKQSTGKCLYEECRRGYFQVNLEEDQGMRCRAFSVCVGLFVDNFYMHYCWKERERERERERDGEFVGTINRETYRVNMNKVITFSSSFSYPCLKQ